MIIDFRCRPPLKEFYSFFKKDRTSWINSRVGSETPESFMTGSFDLFKEELKEACIDKIVVTGRNIPGCLIPNEFIHELKVNNSNYFCFAGIDVAGKIHEPVSEVIKSIKDLGLDGINIDPGKAEIPVYPNDKRIYPIYEKCVELNVPIIIMTGPFCGPDISYSNPAYIDQVAGDFPELKIICGHGCWPWVTEMIGVAFKRPNVYVSPDVYMFMPGREQYIEAANNFMQDQFLFATSFPFRALNKSVQQFKEMPFKPEVMDKLLYINAAKLLKLEI